MSEAELRRRLDSVTAELLSAYEELEVLSTVAEIANATSDVSTAAGRILREAAGLLQADVAFIVYSDRELRGAEPEPIGVTATERDAMAEAASRVLSGATRPVLRAPFVEAAAIPRAPDALLAAPLLCEGQMLGGICLGKRGEGETFSAGDLKILGVLASSAASVLLQRKNLDLTRLSRNLEERNKLFNGILAISREIASSLDLDRLLHALANLPARALGFDRCAVLIDEGARRRLGAVSGARRVDRTDPEVMSLERLLDWVAGRGARVLVQERGEGDTEPTAEPPEAGPQALPHMKTAGARALLAIPLSDDQGMLGVLSFESGTAGFFDDIRLEGATILANQATVALRNARLYGEVPLIGLLAPMRGGLARLGSLSRRRLAAWGAVAAIGLAVLVFGRWELRIPGKATVLAARVVPVSAHVRGVIREVGPYREGDVVPAGAVLARLDANELTLRLNEASAKAETARRTMARLEAEGRAAELRLARVETERWQTEASQLETRVAEASLRAPVEGVLLTPRLQERTGELLEVGALLCTLADTRHLRVEVAVREGDAEVLVRPKPEGSLLAALKFNAFPEADFRADINHVRAAAEVIDGARSLVAEGEVRDPGATGDLLKPGMTGYARIYAGSKPLIVLLLRRPYRFLRGMIWL